MSEMTRKEFKKNRKCTYLHKCKHLYGHRRPVAFIAHPDDLILCRVFFFFLLEELQNYAVHWASRTENHCHSPMSHGIVISNAKEAACTDLPYEVD